MFAQTAGTCTITTLLIFITNTVECYRINTGNVSVTHHPSGNLAHNDLILTFKPKTSSLSAVYNDNYDPLHNTYNDLHSNRNLLDSVVNNRGQERTGLENQRARSFGLEPVKVRFAPSPTGQLHIGSLRTFIFNYLFARRSNGKLVLRIDDTDPARNVPGSLKDILDTLKWTGLEWDEGVNKSQDSPLYYQSNRNDIYREYAQKLIESKHAYRCFCKESLLSIIIQKLFKLKLKNRCNKCYGLSAREIEGRIKKSKFAIKLRADGGEFDDFVLIRSNGTATYNFSSCVDDHMMKITHVIRGSDHLQNTDRQRMIFKFLEVKAPEFVHIPLILDENQSKMSKRLDGISPMPLISYLTLLGTKDSHNNVTYEVNDLLHKFTFDLTGNISFDYKKLLYLNRRYLNSLSTNSVLKELDKFFAYSEKTDKELVREYSRGWIMEDLVQVYKGRLSTLKDYFRDIKASLDYRYHEILNSTGNYGEDFKAWMKRELEQLLAQSKNGIDLHINFVKLLKEVKFTRESQFLMELRFLLTGQDKGPSLVDMVRTWKVAQDHGFPNSVGLERRLLNIERLMRDLNSPPSESREIW